MYTADNTLTKYNVSLDERGFNISLDQRGFNISLARVGPQGSKGATGANGINGAASFVFDSIAGEALGGHRVLTIGSDDHSYYASADIMSHFNAVVGINTSASALAYPVQIQITGIVTEPTWTWTPDQMVFLGLNGVLTQTVPSGALFIQPIGIARTATKLVLNIQPAILKAA